MHIIHIKIPISILPLIIQEIIKLKNNIRLHNINNIDNKSFPKSIIANSIIWWCRYSCFRLK
jgi:hypothetical protein